MAHLDILKEKLKIEKYAGEISPAYLNDCLRLEKGEPYEYVLGHTDFCGAYIDLSLHPMIPRPESAFWVSRAIEELKKKSGTLRLTDTFSGSGNIGLALLHNLPHAIVDICELDPALKTQIEINLQKNHIEDDRARVITASALDGLTGTYDAIFAIPPYIPYEELPELDQEMIEYEPHLAFLAHNDGHEFIKILIEKGWEYLKEGGTLYIEADMDDNEAIKKMIEGTKWSSVEFWPDPYGATPNVVLRK